MRLMKLFAVVFTVLSLAACASGTQYKHMSASMPKLQGDEGRIIFFRGASFAGVAVQPSIMLDGTKVGRSKPGGFFYVDTAAGPHEVTVTSDPDMKLAVTVDKGEVKYIKTSPAFGTMMGKVKFEIVPEADAMKQLPDLASNE